MTRSQRIINDLYCRLSCYTSVTYKNIINTCHCHPTCRLLNTYKNPNIKNTKKTYDYPNAFNVGEANGVCSCKNMCKKTLTNL